MMGRNDWLVFNKNGGMVRGEMDEALGVGAQLDIRSKVSFSIDA